MDFTLLAQQIINGLVAGMSYVLIATGLTLVFGVLRIINFAHGEFYMLGALATYYAGKLLGLNYLVATVLATVAGRRASASSPTGCSSGRCAASTNSPSCCRASGSRCSSCTAPSICSAPIRNTSRARYADETIEIANLVVTQQRVLIFVVAAVVLALLYAFIRYSSIGKMMRATAQNAEGAALTGINVGFVHTYTFALACGLAALAGALVGPTAMIFPTVGSWAVLKGFIVVVMGGLGSMPGALIGGLLLGVIESLGGGYISLGFMEAIGYGIIIVVLLWRPHGLFGVAGHAR